MSQPHADPIPRSKFYYEPYFGPQPPQRVTGASYVLRRAIHHLYQLRAQPVLFGLTYPAQASASGQQLRAQTSPNQWKQISRQLRQERVATWKQAQTLPVTHHLFTLI